MIVDTSALVAIVVREPGYEQLIDALTAPGVRAAIGTATLAELGIVLSARLSMDARPLVAGLVSQFELDEVPLTEAHWRSAIDAFLRFGRGRHPAGLNFGDCLTYAVAAVAGSPLLFVGDDFAATDLAPALRS